MDKSLCILILLLVFILMLLNYIDGKTKQNTTTEIEHLKCSLDCLVKSLEAYKKQVDYRLSFDEKCLYDLVRKTETSNKEEES